MVVAECTQPSLGVGYEIGRALEWGKPIIVLFRPASKKSLSFLFTIKLKIWPAHKIGLSAMIAGAEGAQLKVLNYDSIDALLPQLTQLLKSITSSSQ